MKLNILWWTVAIIGIAGGMYIWTNCGSTANWALGFGALVGYAQGFLDAKKTEAKKVTA